MNKSVIFFSIFSLVLLVFVGLNFGKIDTNIYNVITKDENIKQVANVLNSSLSRDFNAISKNVELLNKIKNNEIFKSNDEINFVKILSDLKLASLKPEKKEEILLKPNVFFQNSANALIGAFESRVLSPQDDLFNLSKFSSILDNKVKFDLNEGLNFVEFNGEKYYFLSLKVKDESNLINFYESIKNNDIIIHSPLLYTLYGKKQGNFESFYMSFCSIILLGIFVFLAFGRARILLSLSVILSAFLFGLSGGFLIFSNIHILSIVVSTSLAGLVMDFTMHFLGDSYKRKIDKNSVKKMLKIFIIALSISALGYFIFLFAFMPLLSQIAVISIFTLFGAFFASYFLVPVLFDKCIFRAHKIFKILIFYNIKLLKLLKLRNKFVIFICAFLTFFGVFALFNINFNDNIKNYMAQPEILLKDSAEFSKIMDSSFNEILILNDISKEKELIKDLKKNALFDDYNAFSKYFLDEKEQNELKELFVKNKENLLKYYNFIEKDDLENALNNLKIVDASKYKDINFVTNKFLLDGNSSLIFLKNPNKNEKFFEILNKYNVKNLNIQNSLNSYFTELKIKAIYLKIFAYIIAWFILIYFYNLKIASFFITLLFSVNLICIGILYILGIDLNIFSIFGLIIASAIGMDYLIIAKNEHSRRFSRVLSIILALFTSLISFLMLCFSSVYAIFSFGISASLGMFVMAIATMYMILKK